MLLLLRFARLQEYSRLKPTQRPLCLLTSAPAPRTDMILAADTHTVRMPESPDHAEDRSLGLKGLWLVRERECEQTRSSHGVR